MTLLELAYALGLGLGGGVGGAFGLSKLKAPQRDSQVPPKQEISKAEHVALKDRVKNLEAWLQRVEEQQHRIEDRLSQTVTAEEFQATSAAFTENIRTLTREVGVLVGSVEAWYKQGGKR